MANYCKRADVEHIFGKRNVQRWADLDNNESEHTIADRVEWAIGNATAYINSRLINGAYDIPFVSPYPEMIVQLTAMYAGTLLYDGRQVVSADDRDACSRQRKDFDRFIKQILRGQMKLIDPSTDEVLELTSRNDPFIVEDEDDEDESTTPIIEGLIL